MRGICIFPNLADIAFSELAGSYDITRGVVDVKDFHLYGDKLKVDTNSGRLDLPGDKVDMDVNVKAGVISLHKVICGSISSPNGTCVEGEVEKLVRKAAHGGNNAVDNTKDVLDQVGRPVKQLIDIFKK